MEKRKCSEFSKKYFFKNMPLIIVAAVSFIVGFIRWWNQQTDMFFYISIIVFIISTASGLIFNKIYMTNFRCPVCKKQIPKPVIEYGTENAPINYYCDKCDIEWETGMSQGTAC
ncbi:UNVERIFIED_CONTAM: hypothetical protein Cloal_4053 [Acetivibrio alkalicellulosi]